MKRILACLFLLIGSIQTARYGVGFTFASSYAVASVTAESGRSWDVAHVKSSFRYWETFDWVFEQPDHVEMVYADPPAPPGAPIEFICGTPQVELFSSEPLQAGVLQALYDKLPPWLGGHRPDPATKALADMLFTLKTATESMLETQVDQAYITLPYPVKEHFISRLSYASSSVGLGPVAHTFQTAEAAVRAYGLGGGCNFNSDASRGPINKEQLVLVLDHNVGQMTATLAVVDCAYSERRILSASEFGAHRLSGADAWIDCSSEIPEQCQTEKLDKLVGALHRLTDAPVRGFGNANLTEVDHIVIVGSRAGDHRLEGALKEVYGERFDDIIRYDYGKDSAQEDSLYAAARYAAQSYLNNTSNQADREL